MVPESAVELDIVGFQRACFLHRSYILPPIGVLFELLRVFAKRVRIAVLGSLKITSIYFVFVKNDFFNGLACSDTSGEPPKLIIKSFPTF